MTGKRGIFRRDIFCGLSRWLAKRLFWGKSGAEQVRYANQFLLLAAAGLLLSLALAAAALLPQKGVGSLERPQAGEGSRRYELNAMLEGERLGKVQVEVPERLLTETECEKLLAETAEKLPEEILGKNPSLDEVREDLQLPASACGGLVDISWESSDFERIDPAGRVENALLAEPALVELTARLRCQQKEKLLRFPVQILPLSLDRGGRLSCDIAIALRSESRQAQETAVFALPDRFEGEKLSWTGAQKPYSLWCLSLTAAGLAGFYGAARHKLQELERKREEQLLLSYPGFVSRLAMLAGTGLPLRSVFVRLAGERAGGQKPVYEEVRRSCLEMQSGLTQAEAFERFGQRCRLPQYKKCAALLGQHLKRGAEGLLDGLWQEAENALEERRALARRRGEEAQTKLLLPMVMMLLVVMLLVMVPACFSFAGL